MYKSKSKRKNRDFVLSPEEFEEIISLPCFYCGTKDVVRGIDRTDSNKGYVIDNVSSCCFPCNRAKSTMTQNEFIALCKKVALRF
jgi:hypothetical protein